MTAININIEQFINALIDIRNNGASAINIDLIEDEDAPGMNKMILHPINKDPTPTVEEPLKESSNDFIKINPEVDHYNNEIFNLLNKLV